MEFSVFVEQLKKKVNIVDIVSRYITLNRKGNRHWGCCPFHHEKTPSFSVDEYNQYYYCFGCKENGDVVKFVQNIEGTDFMGALTILCQIAGMTMPEFSGDNGKDAEIKKRQRDRLYELLKESGRFYYRNLVRNENSEAYRYLIKREISKETMKKFALGLSLDWFGVVNEMRKLGYTDEELVSSGVCGKKEDGKLYDAYGKRIMFPIVDAYNQVVAFGGRTLDKTKNAKYKNTTDTPVFNKKKVLYGLNLVKKERLTQAVKSVIVVEGYMDAISVYEAGFHNVVASMGTAFTREHAKLVRFVAEEVLLCYDGDSAGIKGTILALDILKEENISVKVMVMPKGVDPDDLIKTKGREAFQKAIDEALPHTEFKLKLVRDRYSLEKDDERSKFLSAYLRVIASLSNEAEKEIYLLKMSEETKISLNSLKKDLERVQSGEKPRLEKKSEESEKKSDSVLIKSVRFMLLSVIEKKRKIEDLKEIVEFIKLQSHKDIYNLIENKKDLIGSELFSFLDDDGKAELTEIMNLKIIEKITEEAEAQYFEDCKKNIIEFSINLKITELEKLYKDEKDSERRRTIAKDIVNLSNRLNG